MIDQSLRHFIFRGKPFNCSAHDDMFKTWKYQEHQFTRIITFFIGFYVSFTIRNWWWQVAALPRMDSLCLSMASLILVKPTKKDDEVKVKEGDTVKQYKKTIARLFLLSWAIRLSKISTRLHR